MGFALRPDSEYLSLFNHYLLKAFETGILHRLDRKWHAEWEPPIKIGLTEPEPLGMNNTMFPFSFLAAIMILSVIASVLEKVVKKIIMLKSKSERGNAAFAKRNNNREELRMGRVGTERMRGAVDEGRIIVI